MPLSGRDAQGLPEGGGLYVLVFRHSGRARSISVGALGSVCFRAGYYCYVGSARGGLRGRIERHLRRAGKRIRWHVDYVRRHMEPDAVYVWPGQVAAECVLSSAVARCADGTVARFGSSDCRCEGHLHYFRASPRATLGSLSPAFALGSAHGIALRPNSHSHGRPPIRTGVTRPVHNRRGRARKARPL